MNKKITLLTFLFLTSFLCKAQKTITYNNQQWIQYYNQLKLSDKFTLYSDVSLRRINNFSEWSQVTFRIGVGYPIIKKIQGVTGIACFLFYNNVTPNRIEYRPYQEINTTQKSEKVSVQHRLRIEARYFRKISNDVITSQSNFNFRFRYRLFFGIPLLKASEKKPERQLLLNVGDELFINAGKEIVYNTFDNNRFLIGTTFQVNNKLSFSFTYTYQYTQRNRPSTYDHSDIFWLGITHRLALKKKKEE